MGWENKTKNLDEDRDNKRIIKNRCPSCYHSKAVKYTGGSLYAGKYRCTKCLTQYAILQSIQKKKAKKKGLMNKLLRR